MKKRSKFGLSHYKLATMDMGQLVPVSWFEALPGDTIQMQTSAFVRVAPTLAPTMTPCHVNFMSFAVPLRLLWDNGPDDCFENFITGGPDGTDVSIPPQVKVAPGSNFPVGSLADYLGVPSGEPFNAEVDISAFPFRAYQLIWNEYFRDQDLQPEAVIETTGGTVSGDEFSSIGTLRRVSWKKDYFTVARPFEQKGPAVTIPVNLTSQGGNPLIQASTTLSGGGVRFASQTGDWRGIPRRTEYIDGDGDHWADANTTQLRLGAVGGDRIFLDVRGVNGNRDSDTLTGEIPGTFANSSVGIEYTQPTANTQVTWNGSADTTGSITVDDIREAFALQRFEEARALFGSRYVEYLRYLGVRSSDARLQRPEYLGGGSQVIQWSEVVQTAQGTDPVGTLRGHGVSGGRTRRWRRFFEEHSIIMTLAYIRPIALYTQSLPRSWTRTLKEDYWQKELQHVGQQEVLNKEIYGLSANPDGVFGYMDRYDEYRSVPSTVCGNFRDTLDYWHLGRVFSSQPVLNSDFITCNPSKRIFSEQTAQEFYCMFLHSVQARRLMARKGRPGGL